MPEFYFQIKGKKADDQYSMSNWVFPPIFSGKVTADNRNMARGLINHQFAHKFPTRVLKEDLASNEFLLSIEEIKVGSHIARLFDMQECKKCGKTYYVIDKYNDEHETYKGADYCSYTCKHEAREIEKYISEWNETISGKKTPIIYRIHNRENGLCYIGKTTQVFTLRWYQHFFHGTDCSFHRAIKGSKITDWIFEVIDIVELPEGISSVKDIERLILDRERFWIDHFDSLNQGYNSI